MSHIDAPRTHPIKMAVKFTSNDSVHMHCVSCGSFFIVIRGYPCLYTRFGNLIMPILCKDMSAAKKYIDYFTSNWPHLFKFYETQPVLCSYCENSKLSYVTKKEYVYVWSIVEREEKMGVFRQLKLLSLGERHSDFYKYKYYPCPFLLKTYYTYTWIEDRCDSCKSIHRFAVNTPHIYSTFCTTLWSVTTMPPHNYLERDEIVREFDALGIGHEPVYAFVDAIPERGCLNCGARIEQRGVYKKRFGGLIFTLEPMEIPGLILCHPTV